MSWADNKHQNNIPKQNSAEGKRLEKMVNQTPALKKLRAQSRGDKYSEISTGADVSEEYKANYDQIDWNARDKEPRSFRMKVNGRYVDDEE